MGILQSLRMLKRRARCRYDGPAIIRSVYEKKLGKRLANEPRTFTEKLAHKMIDFHTYCDPIYTRLTDKLTARDYIREKIGAQYLPDLLWSGPDARAIPYEALPVVSFAKANHDSGTNIVLRQPIDRQAVISIFDRSLQRNYYWAQRECQYYKIKPAIMIEQFLDDGFPDGPIDYRFYCFQGTPSLIQVCDHPHDLHVFYDLDWKKSPVHYRSGSDRFLPKPDGLDDMIAISSILSKPFDFVRVDLYNIHGKVYAGELTFTPRAGIFKFEPAEWDQELGEIWNLRQSQSA